jgi:feruloyl-CoA synthase
VFDDEGFFMMGDALQFADASQPEAGLVFSGRVTEEFKLQSGVFVRVGSLRVEAIEAAAGLLTDVVVAGADQAYVALLAWPNLTACRQLIGHAQATAEDLVGAPAVRAALRERFAAHNSQAGGSSRRIHRLLLLCEPPDMGAGEITDKGYVNQRRVLERRAADATRLFMASPDAQVLTLE